MEPKDFFEELESRYHELKVDTALAGWTQSFSTIEEWSAGGRDARRFLVHLDTEARSIYTESFARNQEAEASEAQSDREAKYSSPHDHVILVTVEDFKSLKRAYPGFFADTRVFRQLVARAVAGVEDFEPDPWVPI